MRTDSKINDPFNVLKLINPVSIFTSFLFSFLK